MEFDRLNSETVESFEPKIQLVNSDGSINTYYSHELDTYGSIKRIGIFSVMVEVGVGDVEKDGVEFEKVGRSYIDLGIRDLRKQVKFSDISKSLQLLATYIDKFSINPTIIAAVTHEPLVRMAERYGFKAVRESLDDEIVYSILWEAKKYFGENFDHRCGGVYMTGDEFLERFLPKT